MAKAADLRNAMLGQSKGSGAGEERRESVDEASADERGPHYRPSREGKSNVTGYFAPEVKRQLRIMAAEQDTTIQALLGEALNDLFAKHGRPEIAKIGAPDSLDE